MNQSPGRWLLERHAATVPELDALRRAALPEPRLSGREFLRELFLPSRPVWTAVAAAWIAVFALNASQPSRPKPPRPVAGFAVVWSTSNALLDALLAETRSNR